MGSECPETSANELVETAKESSFEPVLASLNILNKLGRERKRLTRDELKDQGFEETSNSTFHRVLSTMDIIKLAKDKFLRFTTKSYGDLPMLINPVEGHSSLSEEDTKNVELVQWLLASADNFGSQQFDRAMKLLRMCNDLSPLTGSPLERTVYYFARAIREKISLEAVQTSKGEGTTSKTRQFYVEEAVKELQPAVLACQKELPFIQITQFTCIQAVLNKVCFAKRIHLINFGVRIGGNDVVLMQALSVRHECPVELLKITAVGKTAEHVEDTGKRLIAFADTINLPFTFKAVVMPDIKDLKEDIFEVEAGEVIAVYFPCALSAIKARPGHLEVLMGMIKNISPSIIVVTEMEANTDSPIFMERFIEAMFLYGSMFDCFEACMHRDDPNRTTGEAAYIGSGIKEILEGEGEFRKIRHMKIGAWRDIFERFGMVETDLSSSCLYQAKLVAGKFSCGGSCTFDLNGKCLLIGWKGTPIVSLSSWKFKQETGMQQWYRLEKEIISWMISIIYIWSFKYNTFAHRKHPLMLIDLKDATTQGNIVNIKAQRKLNRRKVRYQYISDEKEDGFVLCNFCGNEILELAYSCPSCDFHLHKLCSKSPKEMIHPDHDPDQYWDLVAQRIKHLTTHYGNRKNTLVSEVGPLSHFGHKHPLALCNV